MSLLLLGVGGAANSLIDPSTLANRYFDIDAFTNAGLYSEVSPGLVLCNDGDTLRAWQNTGSFADSPAQATGGFRPVARQNSQNGGWGVDFDGANHFLQIASGGLTAATFVSCTIYMVLNGTVTVFSRTGGSDACQLLYGNPAINRNAVEFVGQGTSAPSAGVAFVDCYQYNGSTMLFERSGISNGTVSVSKTFANPVSALGCTTGPSEFFDGLMHRLIIFQAIHDAATRAGVQAWLKQKWGTL